MGVARQDCNISIFLERRRERGTLEEWVFVLSKYGVHVFDQHPGRKVIMDKALAGIME